MPTLLISDLHLSEYSPVTTRLFADFLGGPARDADRLYILGDLFDYWLGDDALELPFEQEIAGRLAELAAGGTATFFISGNRDFLVGPAFMAAARLSPLAENTVADIEGRRTLLLHGDSLCTDDAAYWEFRNAVRNPDWQRDFLALPLATRRLQVEGLRRRSESAKAEKSEALMDVNPDAVAGTFRDCHVDDMIHGHIHRVGRHDHHVDGKVCRRWVLGAWGATASYLCCDGGDWHFAA